MAKKPPIRMNRRTFWTWAIPIVAAHLGLTILFVNGSSATFWGNVDTALLILMAVALTRRFRDIGWPVWIGPTFMIVTMLVIPMGVIGYAFGSNPLPQELVQSITLVVWVTGPLNLLLIVVAGCVSGKPDADAQIASEFS